MKLSISLFISLFFISVLSAQVTVNDPLFSEQWYLYMNVLEAQRADIRAMEAWQITTGDPNLNIAIIENGQWPNSSHEDLEGRVNVITGGGSFEGNEHATTVAGLIVAKANNGKGIVGVNWQSKLNAYTFDAIDNWDDRIIEAANAGNKIINISHGLYESLANVGSALAKSYKQNVINVVSVGNDNTTMTSPSYYSSVIGVGSSTKENKKAEDSNYGNQMEFLAPGGEDGYGNSSKIISTSDNGGYSYNWGTSFSAPLVTGAASLLLAKRSDLANDDVKYILIYSCDKLPDMHGADFTELHGYGRINIKRALDYASLPYTLNHYTITGGTDVGNIVVNMQIHGHPTLANGNYNGERHEIRASVNFALKTQMKVWGRGSASTGWNLENPNVGAGFCEIVPGTLTSTGATLRTYVYKLRNSNGQEVGWYPCQPQNTVLAYSILDKPPVLSGTILNSESWFGTASLTGNVTVPTGITLTLKEGSTTNLNGHTIVAAGGTIVIENGAIINGLAAYLKTNATLKGLYPSVQTAINAASSGQTVELLAKTYNYLALTISGKSNFKLIGKGADKTFIDQYEGSISITSSTNVLLSDMFVYGPISNTNSSYTVTNNLVYGEACGIYDYNGTQTKVTGILSTPGGAAFGVSCHGGSGEIRNNNISGYDAAIYLTDAADYTVGPGNNFCENTDDIVAMNGAHVYATSNKYSSQLPATIVGNVDYDHGVNGVCTSLAKTAAQENGIALIEDSGSYYPDSLKAIDEEFNSLLTQNKDNEEGLKDILIPVISKYKKFVSGSNTAKDFSLGLQKTMHAYKTFNGNEEFYSYLTELKSAAKYKAYSPVINKFKIWKYADAGNYAQAVATADAVIASGINDTELLAGTLYEKGVILRDYLSDNEGAKISFEQLIKEYPNSPLKRFAEAQLNTVSASKGKADSAAAEVKEVVNVFEAGNYPNPFNPATVIRYSIPEGGNVSLKVYDILGREVAKLVNEFQEAGTHSVEFNGSALSSGIYFYELRSGNNVMIKKMLMMK